MDRNVTKNTSHNQPSMPAGAPRGLDESLSEVPAARCELTAILPPPTAFVSGDIGN
jgi:hypothetical protein